MASCNGNGGEINIRMSAVERPDLGREMASRGRLAIPADDAFNYPKFRSHQEGTTARGESKAVGRDGASCRAEVTGEGTAWGEFQLGYGFDNVTGKALDAVVSLKLSVKESVSHQEGDSGADENATASGHLSFVVKDTNGVELKRDSLVANDLTKGPQSSTNRPELVFDVTFEPDRGYYLVLSGRADVKAYAGQTATVQLEVTDVSLEVRWREAEAAVKADKQGAAPSSSGSGARANTARRLPSVANHE